MKSYLTCATVLFLCSFCEAIATGISATTNGVYLVVGAERNSTTITNEPIRFDDRILWMTFCDSGKEELTMPGNIAYSIQIKMTDQSGNEVLKTALGKRYGTKWDSLHSMYESQEILKETHPIPVLAGGTYKDNPDLGGGRFLPTPNELFRIEKAGIYTLEIQMQMFYSNQKSTNLYHRDRFQFSPISIKVEKPKEK
jgi:hypothetical protein